MAEVKQSERLALFDFDGTLCAGNSLHLLIEHLLAARRGMPALIGWGVLRKLRLATARSFKEGVLGVLRGLPEAELRRLGDEIYRTRIRPRLRAPGLKEVATLQAAGFRIVVVTGGFDFLVQPFCDEHGLCDLLCCRTDRQDGRCTGLIAGPEMLGLDKPVAIRARFEGIPVNWTGSRAYTDDGSDRPMLALVGERYHVRGTTTAIDGARTLDWDAEPNLPQP